MDDFERELKVGFLDEAAQLLTDTEQCFLNLESSSDDPTVIEKIFRLAHNLKGSARGVGFNEMGEFTHRFESLLLKLKNKEIPVNSGIVSLLLECNDLLSRWVEALKADLSASFEFSDLYARLQNYLDGKVEAAGSVPAEDVKPDPVPDAPSADMFAEPLPAMSEPMQMASGEPDMTPLSPPPSPAVEAHPAPPVEVAHQTPKAEAKPKAAQQDESLRVSGRRLEKLMNNVGELVILQTVLDQQKSQTSSPLLQKTISQLAKITKDIQDISMSLRMVPLKPTFQKMQRIVRDTSNALGKEIDFVLSGEETEIDKSVVENIGDPLVHLVRNAVDHGIEDAAERTAADKPVKGRVELKAFHRGGNIVIEIVDDGKGLDAEKLRKKGFEKGIFRQGQTVSDKDAYMLIFHPGFSTKAVVTDISGRGVGLDVVKTNIEKMLKGEVQLETVLGKGTTFRILLPLTMAIIDGMVVMAGTEKYIIPIAQIKESIQPVKSDIHHFKGIGDVLSLRGTNYPLLRLTTVMGRKAEEKPLHEGIAMIIEAGESPYAVFVDDILGQQQVVIKQLGEEIRGLKGVSGGAILGDGRAALILDLTELAARVPQASQRGIA